MIGVFNRNWQGVPAGTEVEILESLIFFNRRAYRCSRPDGGTLPTPFGEGRTAYLPRRVIDRV